MQPPARYKFIMPNQVERIRRMRDSIPFNRALNFAGFREAASLPYSETAAFYHSTNRSSVQRYGRLVAAPTMAFEKTPLCLKARCSDYDLSAFLVREKVPIASRTMVPKQAVMTL